MNDLKYAFRVCKRLINIVFGANRFKCAVLYNLFLAQVANQRVGLRASFKTEEEFKIAAKQLDFYNISGFLPFIYFTSNYMQGTITYNEMLTSLYIMCEKSKQPYTLISQVFTHLDAAVTAETISEAIEADDEKRFAIFTKHGMIPIMIAEYKKSIDNDTNVYIGMLSVIYDIESRQGLPKPVLVE